MSLNTSGFAMRQISTEITLAGKRLALCMLVGLVVSLVSAQQPGQIPVNIFGDGNPDNGIEDNREQLMGGRSRGVRLTDQLMYAGTIECDQKIRGTAVVVDTREFASGFSGVVLATAAHVLYDLNKKQRFKHCEFHFLAQRESARYRAKMDLKKVRMGSFDPRRATGGLEYGEGDWAYVYIPRPWKNFNPDETLIPRAYASLQQPSFRQSGGQFKLVAFDSSVRVISVSNNCTVSESRPGDLGGGNWKGQLLDDCDSGGGASGGGIVATLNGQQFLVGIRNGSHWSPQSYPAIEYPSGPPDGSVWNRNTNTNFARAIDALLLAELKNFIQELLGNDKHT